MNTFAHGLCEHLLIPETPYPEQLSMCVYPSCIKEKIPQLTSLCSCFYFSSSLYLFVSVGIFIYDFILIFIDYETRQTENFLDMLDVN